MPAAPYGSSKPIPGAGVPDIVSQTLSGFNQAIPSLSANIGTASTNISNLLGGMPSADATRTANAYFGVNSGMPGSEFVRNRGFDLYGQQGEQRRQQGLGDLLSLLGGVSGSLTPTAGQNLGAQQAAGQLGLGYANLNQQGNQFNQNLDFQKWLEGNKLGLAGAQLGVSAAGQGANLLGSYLDFLK